MESDFLNFHFNGIKLRESNECTKNKKISEGGSNFIKHLRCHSTGQVGQKTGGGWVRNRPVITAYGRLSVRPDNLP
jgi:hypothetical protein